MRTYIMLLKNPPKKDAISGNFSNSFSNFRAHSAQRILSSSICIDWWLLELLDEQFHLVIFILKKLEAPLQLLQMCFILIQCDIDLETPLCGKKKTCYMKTFSIKKKFRFSGSRFLSIIFFLLDDHSIIPPKETWTFLVILPQ